MTWTYTPDFTTSRDKIRLEIGDTDSTDPQLTDEEIAYLASNGVTSSRAGILDIAASACDILAAKFARQVDIDRALGGERISVKASQRRDFYTTKAAAIRDTIATSVGISPYAGGISISDKDSQSDNDDRVAPLFTRDMHSIPLGSDDDQFGDQ